MSFFSIGKTKTAYKFTDERLQLPVKLSEKSLFILCMLAYFGENLYELDYQQLKKHKNLTVNEIKGIIKALKQYDLVVEQSYYWEWNLNVYINPYYYFTVAFNLIDRHPDWLRLFLNLRIQQSDFHKFLWTITSAVYSNNPQLFSKAQMSPDWGNDFDKYLDRQFYEKDFLPVFHSLDFGEMDMLLRIQLDKLLRWSIVDKQKIEHIDAIIQYYGVFFPEATNHLSDLFQSYRFLMEGIIPTWSTNTDTSMSLVIKAILSLYQGDLNMAGKQFEASLKIHNKQSNFKGLYENELLSFFLILYYAKANTPDTIKKANLFLKKKAVDTYTSYFPTKAIVKHIINGEDTKFLSFNLKNYLAIMAGQPLSINFASLIYHYFNLNRNEVADKRTDLDAVPQCAVLRYELSPYINTDDAQELEKTFGGKPILHSIHQKEYWESVLENLLVATPSETPKTQQQSRLVYLVRDYDSMDVVSQRVLKNGKWSVGTRVSMDKFMHKELDNMDDTDRNVANASFSYSSFCLYTRLAIPHLVGSDRVFYDNYLGDRLQAEIVEEKPFISIEKAKDGFHINTNIPIEESYRAERGVLVKRDSKTHFTVFRLSEYEITAIKALCSLGKFPLHAEPALRNFLEQISNRIEIHSELLEGGSSLQKKEGVSRLILRIIPDKEAFSLEIQAQPLEGGKTRLVPGMGKAEVFDEADGTRYQVTRHIEEEKSHFKEIKDYLESELFIGLGVNQATLSVEDLLDLLEFVSDKTDRFEIEWPEDKKLNLKAKVGSSSFNMGLKSKENWFEVEGEVKVGNDVVSAMEFLNLISHGIVNKRFIKLNETDYIALSENLAKYLNRLEGLIQQSHGKSKIPFYQVGALAEIVSNSDGSIKSDKGMTALMKKIDNAAKMEIAIPSQLQAQLRDYQKEGFEWMVRLAEWGAGACLADDMGLGKTVQAIAFMLYKATQGPSLVVCPASVMLNWANELSRFAPTLAIKIFNEAADRDALLNNAKPYDVVLTTYGLLVREEEALVGIDWNIICLDEAHTIKNRSTKMSATAMKLKAQHRIILTGTPIQNYLSELWNLFQFLNPGLLGSFDSFTKKYIIPIEQEGDKERQRQLKRMIAPFMLRRTKAEVIEELPDKTDIIHRIEMSDPEKVAYESMRQAAEAALESEGKVDVNTLAQITKLRQAACSISLVQKDWGFDSSKINAAADLVGEIVEAGNSVLVFSQFTSFLAMVKTMLEKRIGKDKLLYLDGTTPIRKREKMVADFQHGVAPVFLISLKAGGLGLNLTSANYVIHLDPWWNPAIEQQATDRAYRIGQNKNVTVYHLIAENTIEEKILRLHKTKRDLADSLLTDSNVSRAMTIDDLRYLVEQSGEHPNP